MNIRAHYLLDIVLLRAQIFRNFVIAHDYYNLNPVKIFSICANEIAPLLATVNQIIADIQAR
jgi:uncharacterized protein with HEPN domain